MTKNKNVVLKFRKFWADLDGIERRDLWSIMTALRGADSGDHNHCVKMFTTARIRGELLGKDFYKGFVFLTFKDALRHEGRYSWRDTLESFKKSPAHFYCHVVEAIEALSRYRSRSAIRDLLKFLRTRG